MGQGHASAASALIQLADGCPVALPECGAIRLHTRWVGTCCDLLVWFKPNFPSSLWVAFGTTRSRMNACTALMQPGRTFRFLDKIGATHAHQGVPVPHERS